MTQKTWTRDEIDALLNRSNEAVEKAIVRLWQFQTPGEQTEEATRVQNGAGFSSYAAKRGSYYARWVLSGRHLTGTHLETARKIALRHSRQLVDWANAHPKA